MSLSDEDVDRIAKRIRELAPAPAITFIPYTGNAPPPYTPPYPAHPWGWPPITPQATY